MFVMNKFNISWWANFKRGVSVNMVLKRDIKIGVTGATSSLGQPTCLFLKHSKLFEEIAIFGEPGAKEFAEELNAMDSMSLVTPHRKIKDVIKGSEIVLCVDGASKHEAKNKTQLLKRNRGDVFKVAEDFARYHEPRSTLVIASEPINSLVPMAIETYKALLRTVEPMKIVGALSPHQVRVNAIVSELYGVQDVSIPVVGGSTHSTIVPLMSQSNPQMDFCLDDLMRITRLLKESSGDKRIAEKSPSTDLSAAYGICKFMKSLAKAMAGHENVIESCFMKSDAICDLPYLGTQALFGPNGIERNLGLPELSNHECCLLEAAFPIINEDIEAGLRAFRELNPCA